MLENHGHTVFAMGDSKRALPARTSNPENFDVLFTDMVMPGLERSDLAAQLQALRPDLRVVYMYGYTGELIARDELLKPGITLKAIYPHGVAATIGSAAA